MNGIIQPGGTTVSIRRQVDPEYSVDGGNTWTNFLFPVRIQNSDLDSGILKIVFAEDFIIQSPNDYFIIESDNIQIGSETLESDGSVPSILITVDDYPGLVQNGDLDNQGFNNIYIYNLSIDGRIVALNGGFFAQQGYGNGQNNKNFIINCKATGSLISPNSGGIVGSYACKNFETEAAHGLIIIGCAFLSNIGEFCGGIVGPYGKNVKCEQCWSSGVIGNYSGGIFSYSNENCTAIKCYSTNTIEVLGGGIFGNLQFANCTAMNCYSLGLMKGNENNSAGGIFGENVASDIYESVTAINCYSAGVRESNLVFETAGILGSKTNGTTINCYVANGVWNSNDAKNVLNIDQKWIERDPNTPFEIYNFGFTPYSVNIITNESLFLQTVYDSISAGEKSHLTVVLPISDNNSFEIIDITEGPSSSYQYISINSSTGEITTANETETGVYNLVIRNFSLTYSITNIRLSVSGEQRNDVTSTSIISPIISSKNNKTYLNGAYRYIVDARLYSTMQYVKKIKYF